MVHLIKTGAALCSSDELPIWKVVKTRETAAPKGEVTLRTQVARISKLMLSLPLNLLWVLQLMLLKPMHHRCNKLKRKRRVELDMYTNGQGLTKIIS